VSVQETTFKAEPKRRDRRWWLCVALACTVHLGFAVAGRQARAVSSLELPRATLVELDVTHLAFHQQEPVAEGTPGGGSPLPEPKGPEIARPERPAPAPADAPEAAPAPEVNQLAELADVAPERQPDPNAEVVDSSRLLLSSTIDSTTGLVSALATTLQHTHLGTPARPSATAPIVATSERTISRHYGLGPGANGGPGGKGSGWKTGGVVARRFSLGGTSGAFRADVCFIRPGTRSLDAITRCPKEITFFTDSLAVSPRRFAEGFPGISSRTEWFAIRYRGKFSVTEAGQYYFRLISDDGARLWIDGIPIVDNDGIHPPRSQTGNTRLESGEHELFVSYFQGPRYDVALQLFVTPPGGGERLLRPKM
jgi:hypothetical protein